MVLWQFIVIAALIGALLIYVSVLTYRVGSTNATLKRIEEALLARGGLGGVEVMAISAAEVVPTAEAARTREAALAAEVAPVAEMASAAAVARAAEMAQVSEGAPAAVAQSPETPVKQGAPYLTIRDLKVLARAGRPVEEIAVAVEEAVAAGDAEAHDVAIVNSEAHDAPNTDALGAPNTVALDALDTVTSDTVAPDTVTPETVAPDTSDEASPTPATALPVNEEVVLASLESGDTQLASEEPRNSPDSSAVSEGEDLTEKKNREAMLILNSQRRRRRMRSGY